MDLYFLFFAYCLAVSVYASDSRFIKHAHGNEKITCDSTSFLVMEDETHDCNEKVSCKIPRSACPVSYVCLKNEYKKSNCTEITNSKIFKQTGCYFKTTNTTIYLPIDESRFFGLQMTDAIYQQPKPWGQFPNLSNCKRGCQIDLRGKSWILFKASSEESEDFAEFFRDENPRRTTMQTPKEQATSTGYHTTTDQAESRPRTTKAPTLTTSDYHSTEATPTSSRTITKKPTLKNGDYHSTEATPTSSWTITKIMVFVAPILIVLLLFLVFVALIFYRRRRQDSNEIKIVHFTNTVNESPLGGNGTIDTISHENTASSRGHINIIDDQVLYATIQPDTQFHQKTERQPSAQVPEVVYAELDLGEGLKYDSAPGGPRQVVVDRELCATGGPRHVEVNGELYATVTKE